MRRLPAAVAGACIVVFLAGALPRLSLPGLHHDEVFQAAEAVLFLRGDAGVRPNEVSGLGGNGWLGGGWPWMTLHYVGALKTYLYAATFAVFGAGPLAARGVNVLLGAAALAFSILLAWRLYGGWIAGALGLWLATDPAFLLMSRYDRGPYMLAAALKMAGLYALVRGAQRTSARWLSAGGLFFGVALWDKAHFLWFLAALGLACALCVPARAWSRREVWAPALAGFVVGSAPFLAYNVVYPLATFRSQETLTGGAVAGFFTAWPEILRARSALALQMLDGSGLFRTVTGAAAAPLALRAAFFWGGLAFAAAAFIAGARRGALRPFLFWLTASVAAALAAFLTPLAVGLHHMPMLYPLPHLAAAALLWAAAETGRPWLPRVAAPLLLLGLAGNILFLRGFHAALGATRGSAEWYAGLEDVARYCSQARAPVVTMNLMYTTPLVVYSGGAVIPHEGYPELMEEGKAEAAAAQPPAFLRPGVLLVAFTGPETLYRAPRGPARFMELATRRDERLERVAGIPYSDGGPWTDIYRVR